MFENRVLDKRATRDFLAVKPFLVEDNIPYADEVVGGYIVKDWQRLTLEIKNPDLSTDEVNRLRKERAMAFLDSKNKSRRYIGPVRERDEDESVERGLIEQAVPVSNPAFDEKESDWKMVKTLKGHARNMDQFRQEHKLTRDGKKNWLPENVFGIGMLAGLGSVLAVHGLVTENVLQYLDVHQAPFILKLLVGSGTTIVGNWALNQKFFLEGVVRKWGGARAIARGNLQDELGRKDIENAGREIQEKLERDTNNVVSTIVLGDIVGKIFGAGYEILSGVASHLHSLKYAGQMSAQEYALPEVNDLQDSNVQMGDVLLENERDLPPPSEESQMSENMFIPEESNVHFPEPIPGVKYVIKPDDQMLQVLLENVTNRPYGDTAALDFLKLNKDTIIQAWAEQYGNKGVPMLDENGKFARYTIDHMRNLVDGVIARGETPTEAWDQVDRTAFNNFMNALRGIPAGTEVILPQSTK